MLVEEQRAKPDTWRKVDGKWVQVGLKSKSQRLAAAEATLKGIAAVARGLATSDVQAWRRIRELLAAWEEGAGQC